MRPINSLTITGNLGGDAEHAVTKSGRDMLRFSIGHTHRRKNQSGQWEDAGTTWINVTAFERDALDLARQLTKGARVMVTGPVEHRQYEKRDGTTGYSLDLIADHIATTPRTTPTQQQAGSTWNQAPQGSGFGGFDAGDEAPF